MVAVCGKVVGAGALRQQFCAMSRFVRVKAASLSANGLAQLIAAGHRQDWRSDLSNRPGFAGFYIIRRASSTCAGAAIALEPKVQEGDGSDATGSPHMADMHKASGLVPWIEK